MPGGDSHFDSSRESNSQFQDILFVCLTNENQRLGSGVVYISFLTIVRLLNVQKIKTPVAQQVFSGMFSIFTDLRVFIRQAGLQDRSGLVG